MDVSRIQMGTSVDIKRSDGRIHGAMVSAVNNSTNTVTVEWMEKGETKGKEIDYEQLIGLNPNLLTYTAGPSNGEVPHQIPSGSKAAQMPQLSNGNDKDRKKRRQTGNIVPPTTFIQSTTSKYTALNGKTGQNKEQSKMKPVVENFEGDGIEDEDLLLMPPPAQQAYVTDRKSSQLAANKRTSHTVQEIERLKKNREERRAKQEEMRQHKQELLSMDPGNPNWEFFQMITAFREKLEYQKLKISDSIEDHQICVCVRKRPLSSRDVERKEMDVITVPNRDHMIVHQPQTKVDLTKYLENQTFRFDYAFDDLSTNEIVYKFSAQPLVKTIFEQGFATCFAYGQTGSGKTHTMGGEFHGKSQQVAKGIYALTARDVFRLRDKQYKHLNLQVSCSFFEIYSGKVFDLLNNKCKLRVLEDGKQQVQICGLQEAVVKDENEVLELIQRGSEVRTAGQTSANSRSSRSHAVFQIILRKKGMTKLHGKFSLIDLAGNERGADTISSDRVTRMEGAEINKSLLALKECIRALGRKNAHLPFRASKLTLVLRDSFIGDNARTCMIAMISPGMSSCEHTLNTLRYANRVKELGVDDIENMGPSGGFIKADDGYNLHNMADNGSEDGSDLALLHSHNEDELSEDLYNLQIVMDTMQEYEEKLVDEHSKFYHDLRRELESHHSLLKLTESVDYDTESYAIKLRSLVTSQIEKLTSVKARAEEFLTQLQQEELAAQKAGSRNKK